MCKKLLGLIAVLLASAGMANAQQIRYSATTMNPASSLFGVPASELSQTFPGTYPVSQTADPSAPAQSPMTTAPNAACQGCAPGCEPACKVHGWLGADFLMFFPSPNSMPSNIVATAPTPPGGGAEIVGTSVGYPISFGFKVESGIWLDPDEQRGTQAFSTNLFRSYTTILAPAGNWINSINPLNPGQFMLFGNGLSYTQWFQFSNNEANGLYRLLNNANTKVYALLGPKFAALEEDSTFIYTPDNPGNLMLDEFHTRNWFIGGQIGVYLKHTMGRVIADLEAKCGLGWNYNNIFILGSGVNPVAIVGGGNVLTNSNNIGYYESNSFGVMPEVNGNISYQLTEHILIRGGYSFLLWTNVVRPGNQIGPIGVNGAVAALPGTAPFALSTLFLHGMNFGAEWKF
jgi:hypothetical protein